MGGTRAFSARKQTMTEVLLRPLADAFLQVGVYVAAMLLLFGWLQHRLGDRLTHLLAQRWRSTPLIGALLVMPLYARGTVSFGTVVAALVATMGDSSFVLIAAAPAMALKVHVLLLAAGIVSGYAVDALGIAPRRPALAGSVGAAQALPVHGSARTGRAADVLPEVGWLPGAFWLTTVAGLAVGVPVSFRLCRTMSCTWWSAASPRCSPWRSSVSPP